ncbi:aldo/keto reductase [Pseudalkalibacillus salsuginis]|uniref:aldo/keto reductase n=1 Tax=Pseudalkalibacillus salsuginis TaxID=2910972 RepID=UPI001F207476|nr:aldo/keto reductase [Pseudalkalibacillus salsuginis]MCF6408315.1 aldo/keto reductase [Pseudalkalibacillus salsuginis]
MRLNRLGSSELQVSELGLGCMSLRSDEKEATKIIHKALDKGVTLIDTADLYDFGKNEKLVGKALKGKREQCVLATKVGNRWDHVEEGWEWAPSKDYIKTAVKHSLQRLGTDYIDLYQLHGGTINDPIDEIIEAFEDLKAEGLIREYGISSIRPNVIKEYLKRSNIVSIMMQYSLLDRRPEEWLNMIQAHGVSVIARGPLAKGNLTDRIFTGKASEKGFLDYVPSEINDLMIKVKDISDGRMLSHLALRYPLHHPAVATTIPGASSVEQVDDNTEASNVDLSDEEISLFKQWTKQTYYDKHRD